MQNHPRPSEEILLPAGCPATATLAERVMLWTLAALFVLTLGGGVSLLASALILHQ